jgi:hypothetical protein
MDSTIDLLIRNTVANYSKMLSQFRPCRPGSEFLEQNLITLLSHEFLKLNPDGIAYSEVPFITPNGNGQWGSRLDAYLANEIEGLLVEAKGSQSKDELFQLIENDLERITSSELKDSFVQMATKGDRSYEIPNKVTGLVIADCWYSSHAKQWDMNKSLTNIFPSISKISTKSYKVGEYGKFSYFVLAGQTNILW